MEAWQNLPSTVSGDAGDGYWLSPERIRALAQAFDGQRETPPRLASRLDGAGTVDTGERGLDGQILDEVGQLSTLLGQLGQGFGQDAQGLRSSVDGYEAVDQRVADMADGIASELPASELGIAGKLDP
jgi:hypothetical protein